MFIQVIQGPCTRQDEMRATMEQWRTERADDVVGWLGGTYGFTDDGMFVAVVRFDSEESARSNSDSREQSDWWERTRGLFDSEPQFHDCTDVTLALDGGSDDAGFVQVIQGRVADADRLKSMLTDTDQLHEARPDIIGATLAISDDGTFTETVAFTDEESARRGEQQDMPEEVRADMEAAMADVSYLDLHQPWFASRWG
ncbi:hypothetical protein FE697_004640 [Mumia zhuanghuii]|uniref:Antibiotic biosynthesis monooxygenase n=2 Tax=Mumia TaxID=1546255 RepID=A0ABW1QNQ1_9ACTN|nr:MULTISPECIES: hypothetical protein [Mumia]KAA1425166.1 hypothetical protein FE697_004640 [Mumia zhuanghuii]